MRRLAMSIAVTIATVGLLLLFEGYFGPLVFNRINLGWIYLIAGLVIGAAAAFWDWKL